MFRLLVVEDQVEFYEDYLLRIFEKKLPMEEINVTHVPSLQAALVALLEPWDMVLMDYTLGPKAEFLGNPVYSGADLVVFRRAVEEAGKCPRTYILGNSGNDVANRLMKEVGANSSCFKNDVVGIADAVTMRMDPKWSKH
jgi:CheY-like chemotaxis protein